MLSLFSFAGSVLHHRAYAKARSCPAKRLPSIAEDRAEVNFGDVHRRSFSKSLKDMTLHLIQVLRTPEMQA